GRTKPHWAGDPSRPFRRRGDRPGCQAKKPPAEQRPHDSHSLVRSQPVVAQDFGGELCPSTELGFTRRGLPPQPPSGATRNVGKLLGTRSGGMATPMPAGRGTDRSRKLLVGPGSASAHWAP